MAVQKYTVEQVAQAWEASGHDFAKTRAALGGISRASLYRLLALVKAGGGGTGALAPALPRSQPRAPVQQGPKPKGAGSSFNIYLPTNLSWIRERIEDLARKDRRSVSEIVLMLLEKQLQSAPRPREQKVNQQETRAWLNEKIPGHE